MTEYERVTGLPNQETIDFWVKAKINSVYDVFEVRELLDVGAGMCRYKNFIIEKGFSYTSHDFNQYTPGKCNLGFQDRLWSKLNHQFVCDVLEIPEEKKFDLVLCTEVLEHVPDPVATFQKLIRLVKHNGHIVITVPFMSLAHQTPYWFSSGLSPFWFEYWSKKLNLLTVEIKLSGDFLDVYNQFTGLLQNHKPEDFNAHNLPKIIQVKSLKQYRNEFPNELISSGAFGVFVHLQKTT